ncbi:hypothetical protein CCR75_003489 [Bremia lactucae]|uniref:BAR domain-containing protein n=1 Tax=Bremia lactucae TaxID=4779 RepID=A0A976FQZ6_BRELC|nr:hypothetical protein CCR75_003489 [Bremia lactucae]
MSSLRVRTKNKVLMAFGALKPSTNAAYELTFSDFEATLQRLTTVHSALKSYAGSLQLYHGAANSVLDAVHSLMSSDAGSINVQQQTAGLAERQQFAVDACVASANVEIVALQETYSRLEREVMLPLKGWLHYARRLRNKVTTFQEQKALYDHYARKVAGLRESHEKRLAMRKVDKTKQIQRRIRNEHKLVASTQAYTRLSDVVIRELRAFVLTRDTALVPLLERILRGRVLYAERQMEAANHLRTFIQDSVEDKDGGVLSHFANMALTDGSIELKDNLATKISSVMDDTHGFTESMYTPPHAVPEFLTFQSSSNPKVTSHWSDAFWCATLLSSIKSLKNMKESHTRSSPTSVSVNVSEATAPLTDTSWTRQWNSAVSAQFTQQSLQVTVPEFRDLHSSALGGETCSFH